MSFILRINTCHIYFRFFKEILQMQLSPLCVECNSSFPLSLLRVGMCLFHPHLHLYCMFLSISSIQVSVFICTYWISFAVCIFFTNLFLKLTHLIYINQHSVSSYTQMMYLFITLPVTVQASSISLGSPAVLQ